jgi:outer membrane immunogenic protein
MDNTASRTTVDIVRGGLSYKFGAEGGAEAGLKDTASVSAWSGSYVGINGGGGWGHTSFPTGFSSGSFAAPAPDQSSSGGLFGGHLGHNWQYGRTVAGLEADFDAADIEGTGNFAAKSAYVKGLLAATQQPKIDELASIRARLGWEVSPNLLAYGTGGIGLGHFQYSLSTTIPAAGPAPYLNGTSAGNEFGWVAGAGVEYKLLDRWLLRAEYLHYDFGMINNSWLSLGAGVDSTNARTTVDVVRTGVSYKFGPGGIADSSLKDPDHASDWSGLYAGINGGGGWAQTDFPSGAYWPSILHTLMPSPGQNSSGGLVGGHLGYNWQYGRAVAGLEVDFDAADIESKVSLAAAAPSTYSQTFKIDELASLRGRLGFEVQPGLLAYGTAGLGFGHFQAGFTNITPVTAPVPYATQAGGGAEFGWVAGAGLEYKLASHWLLRAEYLHYDFGTVNNLYTSTGSQPGVDATLSRTTVDAVRGGVSYKF